MAVNPYASAATAAALQSAQWSVNNNFGGMLPAAAALPASTASASARSKGKPQWPLCFDTNGGAYVFQAHSGCFFEPLSEFYYCPKSKLYYSAVTGVYYRQKPLAAAPSGMLTEDQLERFMPPVPSHPFVPPSESPPVQSTPAVVVPPPVVQIMDVDEPAKTRKPVVLSLGIGKRVSAKETKVIGASPADVAKWMKRDDDDDNQTEQSRDAQAKAQAQLTQSAADKQQSNNNSNSSSSAVTSAASASASTTSSSSSAPPRFVCLLCSRQFQSAEHLSKHENQSKLHADNLAKKKAEEEAAKVEYRDRAAERRKLYGQPDVPIPEEVPRPPYVPPPPAMPVAVLAATMGIPPPPPAPVTADVSNPGAQLLRRMGWQEGEGLGKDGAGISEPIAAEGTARGGAGVGAAKGSSSIYGTGSGYRESLQAAARQRFEQL